MSFTLWALMRNPRLMPDERPSNDRTVLVNRYFWPAPSSGLKTRACLIGWSAAGLATLAVILLIHGQIILSFVALAVALFSLGIGMEVIQSYESEFHASTPRPTEAQMDGYLAADRDTAVGRAGNLADLTVDQIGLAVEATLGRASGDRRSELWPATRYHSLPTVHGPVLDDPKLAPPVGIHLLPMRFRAHQMLVLCPTRHHLCIYKCRIDTRNGKVRDEELREIYYADIAMVSLVSKLEKIVVSARDENGIANGTYPETLRLGELHIACPSDDRGQIVAWAEENAKLQDFVTALRALLRERKQPLSLL